MSDFSDSEHEDDHKKKQVFIDENWGDDVSVIERYDGPSPWVILCKMAMALILIGACSGALVYSIITSEDKQAEQYHPGPYFPIYTNQESPNGTLTIVSRTNASSSSPDSYNTTVVDCNWIQDNSRKRIYHRVGLKNINWKYTYYVFETITFVQSRLGCIQMDQTYDQFLESMGLTYILKNKDEEFMIGGGYRNVLIYEGEPPMDVTIQTGRHPSLIRGYADSSAPLTYGWEMYYAHDNRSTTYKLEYYFPEMVNREPDYGVFDQLPDECLAQNKTKS